MKIEATLFCEYLKSAISLAEKIGYNKDDLVYAGIAEDGVRLEIKVVAQSSDTLLRFTFPCPVSNYPNALNFKGVTRK